jgi:hypothetical protein
VGGSEEVGERQRRGTKISPQPISEIIDNNNRLYKSKYFKR